MRWTSSAHCTQRNLSLSVHKWIYASVLLPCCDWMRVGTCHLTCCYLSNSFSKRTHQKLIKLHIASLNLLGGHRLAPLPPPKFTHRILIQIYFDMNSVALENFRVICKCVRVCVKHYHLYIGLKYNSISFYGTLAQKKKIQITTSHFQTVPPNAAIDSSPHVVSSSW